MEFLTEDETNEVFKDFVGGRKMPWRIALDALPIGRAISVLCKDTTERKRLEGTARSAALARGLKAQATVKNDKLYIRFVPKDGKSE